MQLVNHRPSQSWEALHQFNGLPVDFNVKSIARTQVQHTFLRTSLLLNTSYLNIGSHIVLCGNVFSFKMKHFINLAKLIKLALADLAELILLKLITERWKF